MQKRTIFSKTLACLTYFRRAFSASAGRLSRRRRKESPTGLMPSWEPGSGHYGKTWGTVTAQPTSTMDELTLKYIATVPVPSKKGVFTIGDYGTNDGSVSMPLFTKIIKFLREKHGDDLAVQVVYEDQEKNDFHSLFNRLCDESSYLSKFTNVYPMATNVNFYKQCVPCGSCDVIFCSNSVHWLQNPYAKRQYPISKRASQILCNQASMQSTHQPLRIRQCHFEDAMFELSLHVTDEEFRHFRDEAAGQWEKFLLQRARELKLGGVLVVLGASIPENFRELIQDPDVISGNDDAINRCNIAGLRLGLDLDSSWREMRDKGFITEDEYRDFFLPMTMRTAREITSPLEEVTSPVRQAGLQLEYFDEQLIPNPLTVAIPSKMQEGSERLREHFANRMIVMTKTLFAGHLHGSLCDKHGEEEKKAIVEKFFSLLGQRIARVDPAVYTGGKNRFFRLVARKAA